MGYSIIQKEHIYRYTEIFSRWMLAMIFLFAGLPKIIDIPGFAEVIEAYGLIPDFLLLPTAAVISTAEVAAAIGLVFQQKWALHLITILMALFIVVLSYSLLIGLDIDCGCFAEGDPEFHAFSGLRTALIRDLLLLLPLFYIYFRPYIENFITRGLAK